MRHNVLGTVGQTGTWRNEIMDSTFLAAATFDNEIIKGEITPALEQKEYQIWLKKLKTNNVHIGPAPTSVPSDVVLEKE